MTETLLGLPLKEALRRLRDQRIEPAVSISRAPRRPEGVGAFRVVRVKDEGRSLVVCAFLQGEHEDG